jgi:hypothetical protein
LRQLKPVVADKKSQCLDIALPATDLDVQTQPALGAAFPGGFWRINKERVYQTG